MAVYGVDFSYHKPDPVAIKAAGYTFTVGYVSPDARKNVTAEQVTAYRAAGLLVGLVWEDTPNRVLSGAAGGAADGAAAQAQAAALGYPTSAPLFFPVDYQAPAADYPAIAAYAAAFTAAVAHPVGVYGDADVVDYFAGTLGITYGWQTVGWSRGRISTKAHLLQYPNTVIPPGAPPAITGAPTTAYDVDELLTPLPLYGWVPPAPPGKAPVPFGAAQAGGPPHPCLPAIQATVGARATRYYGWSTARAVRGWQARRGLAVDGVFGPECARAALADAGLLRAGSTGPAVTLWQHVAGAPLTGVFDAATAAATRGVQQYLHLTPVDGVVGPDTRAAAVH